MLYIYCLSMNTTSIHILPALRKRKTPYENCAKQAEAFFGRQKMTKRQRDMTHTVPDASAKLLF